MSSDDSDESEVVLTAGATGNAQEKPNKLPQLLAGMEKIAGDLAISYLQSGSNIFQQIWIFRLIIDYKADSCKMYKLEINFIEKYSKLHQCDKVVKVDEG